MRLLPTILFSFFTFLASAQINADTLKLTKGNPVKWKLYGKIKSIRTGYIDLFPKEKQDREVGNTIRKSRFLIGYRINKLKFDKNGNNIKTHFRSKKGQFKSKWSFKCEFDKNNNLTKRTYKSLFGEDYEEILLSKTVKNDTLIYKYKNLTKDSTYAYYHIFNDKLHIIQAGNFQNSDRTYFYYDSSSYLTRTENYIHDTLSSIEKYSYRFDENNNLICWSYYTNSIQEYKEERKTIRDENGIIIKETLIRTINEEIEVLKHQPIFDRKGSWKKSKNLKTGEITKRRIRYYWF